MDFHSIIHYMKDERGHFYHYHLGMQECIESLEISFKANISQNVSLSSIPSHWQKSFHPFPHKRSLFFKDCRALFSAKEKKERIFFLEFFKRKDFTLIAVAALLFSRKKDHFWILYRDDLTLKRKKDRLTIRFLSKLLQWKFRKRFIPLTDSEGLARYYKSWFSQPIEILPIMHVEYEPKKQLSTKKRLLLSWPGAPREEKGLKEIRRLAQLQDPAASRFILAFSEESSFAETINELELRPQKRQLTQKEYFDHLKEADIVLLPYHANQYKWRTSGIFIETIAAGKIPVVKEGSWLAQELLRFDLSELVVDWDSPSFFTDLYQKVYQPEIHEKLEKMQQSYATFHCKENFHKKIKELVENSLF